MIHKVVCIEHMGSQPLYVGKVTCSWGFQEYQLNCKWSPRRIEWTKISTLMNDEVVHWKNMTKSVHRYDASFCSFDHPHWSECHWSCFIEPSRLCRFSDSYRHQTCTQSLTPIVESFKTLRHIWRTTFDHLTNVKTAWSLKRYWRAPINHRSSMIIKNHTIQPIKSTQHHPTQTQCFLVLATLLAKRMSLLGEKLRWWRWGPTKRKVFASLGKFVWRSLEGL